MIQQCCCGHVVGCLSGMLSAQIGLLLSGNQCSRKKVVQPWPVGEGAGMGKTWISGEGS